MERREVLTVRKKNKVYLTLNTLPTNEELLIARDTKAIVEKL